MGGEKQQTSTFKSELYQPCFEADWYNHILYDLAEWANGLAFRSIHFSPQGKPVIKIAEMKNGISSQTKFTEGHFDQIYHVAYGDMLFSWSGQPETSIDVFIWRGPDGWLNQHIFKVHPKRQCDKQFFFYLLRYLKPNFVRIARNKQTTGLGHVTKKDLRNISVKLPPLPEQRAIAHILGSLDNKIELNHRMNHTLEAMAKAIFKSWFVDFDPVRAKAEGRPTGLPDDIAALFPDSFENSEIGEIPKGWEVKPIGQVVKCVGGSTPSTKNPAFWAGGKNPFVTPKDMSSLTSPVILDTSRYITDAGVAKISSGRLPSGTVILSSRAPIGYLAITEVTVSVNQGVIAMICNKDLPNHYVLYWTETNMETIKSNASGTTFAEISKRNFRPMPVAVPVKPVLDAFVQQVEPLHRQLVLNLQESATLARLRDTFLPKLISGELRIPDSAKFLEEAGL